jgi:leucyl-tRNA synthetase
MGMGLLEGEAMSTSKGHVVLPNEAVDEYGADTVRLFLLNSAEPWQDFDWRDDQVAATRDQLERFWNRAQEVVDYDAPEGPGLTHIDRWLLSKLQDTVREATEALDEFETRTASQAAFYGFEEHLKWYRRRADLDRPGAKWTLQEVLRARLRLLAPFIPFVANELHEQLTGEPATEWPEPDTGFESERTEVEEGLIGELTDDVHDIVDVTGTDPDRVRVFVAADWKRDVFDQVVETGPDVGAVMSEVMGDPDLRERGDEVNDLVQELVEFVRERDEATLDALDEVDEVSVYEHATRFLGEEFDADVEVVSEDDTDAEEAATPCRSAPRCTWSSGRGRNRRATGPACRPGRTRCRRRVPLRVRRRRGRRRRPGWPARSSRTA